MFRVVLPDGGFGVYLFSAAPKLPVSSLAVCVHFGAALEPPRNHQDVTTTSV